MLLLPPQDSKDSLSTYHIAVEMNCFNPGSYITVLRRGLSEGDEFIGEFE